MGDNNPDLYLFDALMKVWSQKTAIPQNPIGGLSIDPATVASKLLALK